MWLSLSGDGELGRTSPSSRGGHLHLHGAFRGALGLSADGGGIRCVLMWDPPIVWWWRLIPFRTAPNGAKLYCAARALRRHFLRLLQCCATASWSLRLREVDLSWASFWDDCNKLVTFCTQKKNEAWNLTCADLCIYIYMGAVRKSRSQIYELMRLLCFARLLKPASR